jgi:hypothetical protein
MGMLEIGAEWRKRSSWRAGIFLERLLAYAGSRVEALAAQ